MSRRDIRYARFSQRLLAHNIDLLPYLLLLYALSSLIPKTSWDYVFFGIIYLGYQVGFEISPYQATPGKKWVKIRIVSDEGSITFSQSLLRNSAKFLSLLLFFSGFILILFNARKRALHDYLAGTLAICDD